MVLCSQIPAVDKSAPAPLSAAASPQVVVTVESPVSSQQSAADIMRCVSLSMQLIVLINEMRTFVRGLHS